MAQAKLNLPKEWRTFANRYGADRAYWYVPKGLAITPAALKSRLQVLKEFEGGAKPWRDLQQQYVQRLNDEKISNAGAEWPEGGAPLARMLNRVFGCVGLAWVDPDEHVGITTGRRGLPVFRQTRAGALATTLSIPVLESQREIESAP